MMKAALKIGRQCLISPHVMDYFATIEARFQIPAHLRERIEEIAEANGMEEWELLPLLRYMAQQSRLSGSFDSLRTVH